MKHTVESFLPIDKTNRIRGLCAIGILLHHISQHGFDGMFFIIFFCVSLYF